MDRADRLPDLGLAGVEEMSLTGPAARASLRPPGRPDTYLQTEGPSWLARDNTGPGYDGGYPSGPLTVSSSGVENFLPSAAQSVVTGSTMVTSSSPSR